LLLKRNNIALHFLSLHLTCFSLFNQTCLSQIDNATPIYIAPIDSLLQNKEAKDTIIKSQRITKKDTSKKSYQLPIEVIFKKDSLRDKIKISGSDYFKDKEVLIGCSNYFMPTFRGPGFLYSTNDKWFSPGLNFVHCFTTDLRLQKRISFCSSLQLMFSGIAYKKTNLVEYGNGRSYDYPNSARYNGNMSNPMKFVTFNISAGAKVFQKNSKWPEGRYSKLEFVLFLEEVKYKSTKFVNYAEQPVAVGSGDYFYKNFAIAYTLGKQEVLFKKFILDYGIRVGFTPMVIPNYFYNSLLVSNMEMRLRVDSNYRLFREQLLNVHLGLGFLSF